MGKIDKDRDGGKLQLSRRDFLKASAATAAVGAAGIEFATKPSSAAAADKFATYHTTCPYCSASCGQLVDVDNQGNVLDIYGDHMSPMNDGGLCAKGAGTYQLVTNRRRIGATDSHPENPVFNADPDFADGVAYKREGDGAWSKVALGTALTDIAEKMRDARDNFDGVDQRPNKPSQANGYNSKRVAFFGSSHMNNEQNYTYRRLIAQFGTSNVEHQARI